MQPRWGVFLCTCRGTLPVEPGLAGSEATLVRVAEGPEALPAFAADAATRRIERVLLCCCSLPGDAGGDLTATVALPPACELDLRALSYRVHPDPAAASAKARRLIAAAQRAAEAGVVPPENHLAVDDRVLLHSEGAGGLALAAQLAGSSRLTLLLDEVPGDAVLPPAAEVERGHLERVEGRLGAFHATWRKASSATGSAPVPVAAPDGPARTLEADQVVTVTAAPSPLKRRTGLHLLSEAEASRADAADRVRDLIGAFSKPEHVAYTESICAGGAAGHEACGLCIHYCPYGAVARQEDNPLRIRVDHLTCEGCGACVAACPTSALQFTGPTRPGLAGQLGALLANRGAAGESGPPLTVFHCGEQGRRVLERAAAEGSAYPAAVLPVEVPCLRFVSEAELLGAFRLGSAGVALLGCEACPHGERELLLGKLRLTGAILDAFGLGAGRQRLVTAASGEERGALDALRGLADGLAPAPVRYDGRWFSPASSRESVAESIRALIAATGREPGGVRIERGQPYAFAEVEEQGCTLCRSCVNVCPTHAFVFDTGTQSLTFSHLTCIGCGLCEQVCPERVITLRQELYLERAALEPQTVAQDESVACARCGKPFGNRRSLERVEATLFAGGAGPEAFRGDRRRLLRMCPDCRAAAAMLEVGTGWRP
ncbi:MAG: 4Fe-4S dicluster domain-containing protein [Candidatus Lambdaproteobacteria bacterium]|nr:4Fe-4S dicluster domain-containing protein [Candidatus Lambdaproteobacteria bacterium]